MREIFKVLPFLQALKREALKEQNALMDSLSLSLRQQIIAKAFQMKEMLPFMLQVLFSAAPLENEVLSDEERATHQSCIELCWDVYHIYIQISIHPKRSVIAESIDDEDPEREESK